ncbi:MAG: peptidylprolyl isomerase [Hyphomonadaceae bacterium]|nr:peptidylprolyl isomerase [Hyphomonadaceae bacterium]MBX3510715.1 peptidylprolyl isomerase [Hyphomonadaceae bacterium]
MNWKHWTAAAVLAALVAGTAAPAAAQLSEGVAAIVNDRVISTYDVRQRAHLLLVSAGIQATPEMLQRARAQALRDLVDERLQMEEAQRFNVNVTSSSVDQRINDIARGNNTSVEALAQALAAGGTSLTSLRQQIEAEIAWQRIINGLYGSRVRVSEVEIRETQERIAANATRPNYLISEIFLPANSEQEFAEMEAGARRLIEEMQRGAPFPLVARQFSQSPSAAAGGDIGWIADRELAPELQPVAERLQPGQVSLPVRTPNGVYIIALRERRAGAAAGSSTLVSLRQISAPAARSAALERVQRRVQGCAGLDREASSIEGGSVIDLGQTTESELSPAIRARIDGVAVGAATPVQVSGEQASLLVVCARETGGSGVPSRSDVEARLRDAELTMLADRYLRNLRREATIITRTQ